MSLENYPNHVKLAYKQRGCNTSLQTPNIALSVSQIENYANPGLLKRSHQSVDWFHERTSAVSPGIRLPGSSRRTVRQVGHVDALFAVRARYFSSRGRRYITNYDSWRDKRTAKHGSASPSSIYSLANLYCVIGFRHRPVHVDSKTVRTCNQVTTPFTFALLIPRTSVKGGRLYHRLFTSWWFYIDIMHVRVLPLVLFDLLEGKTLRWRN